MRAESDVATDKFFSGVFLTPNPYWPFLDFGLRRKPGPTFCYGKVVLFLYKQAPKDVRTEFIGSFQLSCRAPRDAGTFCGFQKMCADFESEKSTQGGLYLCCFSS